GAVKADDREGDRERAIAIGTGENGQADKDRIGESAGKTGGDTFARTIAEGAAGNANADGKADEGAEIKGADDRKIEGRTEIAGRDRMIKQAGRRKIVHESDQASYPFGWKE